MRIGHGYDVHKLTVGRKLILGGVELEFEKGLLGHSDADVLIHSIIDSLLGAAALGDIGKLFPDSNPEYKDISSLKLLEKVVAMINDRGFTISNIDATVIAEMPKMANKIYQMRKNIAYVCKIDVSKVSVKATTEEGLGFSGSGEGIASHAVCLLERV